MPSNFIPDGQFKPDELPSQQPSQTVAGGASASFIPDSQFVSDEDKYGSTGQQIGAGLEGVARGVAGPLAPAAEEALGVPAEDIRGREKANPITSGLGEGAGFVGSLFVPEVKALGLAGQVANVGEHVAAVLPKATSVIGKLAQTGVKAGAEMAALQTSDELSKMVTQDPDQTLGTAAANIGLSGILGGAGGVAIGAVSPLFSKASNILGIQKVASDFMGETKAIQEAGDPVVGATKELSSRIDEAENMNKVFFQQKPDLIAKTLPEPTPENLAKVDGQVQDIFDKMTSRIDEAEKSVKTKAAVPYLREDLTNWLDRAIGGDMTDKYLATNKLKQDLASYAKWGLDEEGSAKAALGAELSSYIRPALEDTKVWGAAGDIQKETNKAISEMFDATKDFRPQVTTATMGERAVDPAKVQSLINQTNAGKISRKASVVGNYLDATQKAADTINKVHIENGLESPIASQFNPTPILDHALNTPVTPGVALARWANKHGSSLLANAVGETGAGIVGGGLGALVGHPLVGAWMGERVLSPIFSALAKPLAENAINTEAAKATVDYLGNVVKGQKVVDGAVKGLFNSKSEVIAKDLIPDEASREKLTKSLGHFSNPANAINVGGAIVHYLPGHAQAAGAMGASAQNYLYSLKPNPQPISPLDSSPPPDKSQLATYNRALDIAQQPLMALKHAKDGTLLPQDVQTLQTIYPGLHKAIVQKLTNELIQHKSDGNQLPYHQRQSLNMLIGGAPLDSTMTPGSMQAVIAAAGTQQMNKQAVQSQKKASGSELSQINKVNALYQTGNQAREAQKRS